MGNKTAALTRGLFALGFLLAASYFFLPLANPDFFWHLSAGRYIISHLSLPATDFLSWTEAGKPWTDFEWLPQVMFWLAYTKIGYFGVMALKAAVLFPALWIFWKTVRLYKQEDLFYAAAPFWAAALLPSLDIRPENCTILFFSAEIYWLEKIRLRKLELPYGTALLMSIPFFMLWANLHAGFIYGLFVIACSIAGEFIRTAIPAVYNKPITGNFRQTKWLALLGIGAFAGSLMNLYGWKVYSVAMQHASDLPSLQENILEWQPASITNVVQWPFWVLFLMVFLLFLWRWIKARDIPYEHLIVIFYFAYASASHSRHTMFFVITGLPFVLNILSVSKFEDVQAKATRNSAAALLFILAIIFSATFVWKHYSMPRWHFTDGTAGTINFLKADPEFKGKRLYNPWGWGGVLGYELAPDYKVFQDGRYIFHRYLNEVQQARQDTRLWKQFLNKYNFDVVILQRIPYLYPLLIHDNGQPLTLWRPFYIFFMPKPEWALVYWDTESLVFAKRSSFPPELLERLEYGAVRPDDGNAISHALRTGQLGPLQVEQEVSRLEKTISIYASPEEAAENLDSIKKAIVPATPGSSGAGPH